MTKLGLKTGSVSFHSGPVAPRPSPPLVSTGHGSARQQPWPGPLALCWPPVCGSPGTHAGGIPTDSLRKHRAQRDRPPPAGHPRPSYQRAVCTSHACPSSAALRVRTCSFCLWQVSFEQLLSRGHFFNQPPPRPFPGMLLGPRRKQTWRMEVLRRKGPDVFMERSRIFSYPPLDRDFAAQAFSRNFSFISDVMDQSSGVLLPLPNL